MTTAGTSLAERGAIPLELGMWAPNLLFLALSFYLLVKAANESPVFFLVWLRRPRRDSAGNPRERKDRRMRIITRFLIREFILNFSLGLGTFSTIYLIVEFFERINAFLYNNATWPMMAAYFLNKIPSILFQVAPAAVLLATIDHPGHDVQAQ